MFKKRPIAERRPVVGWEGIYEVSNDGRVFRVLGGTNTFVGRELKPHLTTNGYFQVMLSSQKPRKGHYVHRLVATAFLENPENLPQVNHKDSNRKNNYYSNLEWCTAKQNNQHAVENGKFPVKKPKELKIVKPTRVKPKIVKPIETGDVRWFNNRPCKSFTWRYEVI